MESTLEALAGQIEALEVSDGKGRGRIVLTHGIKDGLRRAALAALVRCLGAVKWCNNGHGGVDEAPDGAVIAKAAAEILDRIDGKPPTMNLQLSGALDGEAKAGADAAWTPELIAAVQGQLDRARAKLGGAVVSPPTVDAPRIEGNAGQIGTVGENGQENAVPCPIPPKRPGRPRMKKTGAGTT